MTRPLAAFLAGCALATLVAGAVALYTLPRLVVPVAARASADTVTMPQVRPGRPFFYRQDGTSMLCVASGSPALDPPLFFPPTATPIPAGSAGGGGGYPAAPPYVP